MGTVFASNRKAYKNWKRKTGTQRPTKMSDRELEGAIMRAAAMFPENVTRVTA